VNRCNLCVAFIADRLNDPLQLDQLGPIRIEAERHLWVIVPENFGRFVLWNTRVLERCARAASERMEIDPITTGNLVDVDEL
jgi:hypothetical protein